MFAFAAAVMFFILAIKVGVHVDAFWLYLGLTLWMLHLAFEVAMPAFTTRRKTQ